MSENQQTTANADFSADVIRGFLLGRLSSAEQAKFEERLLIDDDLDERMRLAEFELADDFILERMTGIDRQRFAKTFMLTRERRRALIVSTALRDRFSVLPEAGTRFWKLLTRPWGHSFNFNHAAWRFAFGALVLFVLLASAWLVTKRPPIVWRVLPKLPSRRPAAPATPQPAHHPHSAAPVHRETASPLPAHEATSPNAGVISEAVAVTVVLSPAGEISEGSIITLPASPSGVVRFQLAFDKDRTAPLRAELETLTGQSVFSVDGLKSEGGPIELKVPASALKPGDYQIRLRPSGEGSNEAARYYFRVK